jgi:phosphopantothenoylcysteine decarboxylase / phosphopantothenate---cysteine ligase
VDILATVASLPTPPFCVGFAAESENVVEYARKKRENKHISVIVANLATEAIGANDNQVTLIDDAGEHPLAKAAKAQIAAQIVAHVANLYLKQTTLIASESNIKSIKPSRTHNA